jgi:hypothetical protein
VGAVFDGPAPGVDVDHQYAADLTATWEGFTDDGSGIASYEWAIGISSEADVLAWTNVTNVTTATTSGIGLVEGATYYVSVRARDHANNVSLAGRSDGVTIRTGLRYFEKSNRALDYMGVSLTATTTQQRVFAPGTPAQEYPGGWVTPGSYVVALNLPRIHDRKDGTLTGATRAGDAIVGLITSRTVADVGWMNHAYDDPADCVPQNWGQSRTITLRAGDTVHVAYGDPSLVFGNTRRGSDGIVVYCVAEEPDYRGGLWGTGRSAWSRERWGTFVSRVRAAAHYFTPQAGDAFWGGPRTIPDPLPADFANDPGNLYDNQQATNIGRWLLHRSMDYIKTGQIRGSTATDANRLFEYFCNNVQTCFCFSDRAFEYYHYAHGPAAYPPYFADSIKSMLVGAVAFDYDPDYEPLARILTYLAQRVDMTLPHIGGYTYRNQSNDPLANHIDDDDYTRWLWNTVGVRDMQAAQSHRLSAWYPAFWARTLFSDLPVTPATPDMLNFSGWGPNRDRHGHEWVASGVGAGWKSFYARLEIVGAMWGWFTDTEPDSQAMRWPRRNFLYPPGASSLQQYSPNEFYYVAWVQATFVPEPTQLTAALRPGGVLLDWADNNPTVPAYRVYRRTSGQPFARVAQVTTSTHNDTTVQPGTRYEYAVAAVNAQGHESSRSDVVAIDVP